MDTSHFPKTVEELTNLTWSEFEKFATNVLRLYYNDFKLELILTPLQHDGGRDAEATYLFGASSATRKRSLAAFFKLWVEVKQIKNKDHVGLERIGKNLVRAMIEEVSKLIVVTNTEYTSGLIEDIEKFACRTGIDYSLITGKQLIDISECCSEFTHPEIREAASLHQYRRQKTTIDIDLSNHLSLAPLTPREQSAAQLSAVPGSPVFIIVDLAINSAPAAAAISIELKCNNELIEDIYPYGRAGEAREAPHQKGKRRSVSASIPLANGDRRRRTYVFFPKKSGHILASDINVIPVVSRRGLSLKHSTTSSGELRIVKPLISDWIPPSRQRAFSKLESIVNNWLASEDLRMHLVVASAGTGKSHAVAHLRCLWLSRGVNEVHLDGALQSTDISIMESIFQQVFPIEPRTLGEDQSEPITRWLQVAGMNRNRAREVATAVCSHRALKDLDIRLLAEVASALLKRNSALSPLVFLFEDLHKCQPSAVSLLNEIQRYLKRGGGRIFLLMTSRQQSSATDIKERNGWLKSIENLPEEIEVTKLHNPTHQESIQLILKTIPFLEAHYADSIIEQVGRSPFGIREALHYLKICGMMTFDDKLGSWLVPHPEELYRAIELEEFTRATQLRIFRFFEERPPWLQTTIEAGACAGRFFSIDACLFVADQEDGPSTRSVLGECEEAELIRPSSSDPGQYLFDHDLIRTAILRSIQGRQRWIAGKLLNFWEPSANCSLLGALAYQAGYAEKAFHYASSASAESIEHSRYADAVGYLWLTIRILDPDSWDAVLHSDPSYSIAQEDEAIHNAPTIRISNWPSSKIKRSILSSLLMIVRSLLEVGKAGSEIMARCLSEAFMLARSQNDLSTLAELELSAGRREFSLGKLEAALVHHEKAEESYSSLHETGLDLPRVTNLVWLAISLRQIGRREESLSILQKANAIRHKDDDNTAVKILQNCGALYFYSDPAKVRHHWSSALLTAERSHTPERVAHCLVDLALLDILDDHLAEARGRLDKALRITEDFGLEESALRTLLHFACLDAVEGDLHTARLRLIDAEKLSLSLRNFRHLWRIRANLATVYEVMGELDRSYAHDVTAIGDLNSLLSLSPSALTKLERLGREVLPFVNVALRSDKSAIHGQIFENIPPHLKTIATNIANCVKSGRLPDVPNLLGRHCKHVSSLMRFVITE